MAVIGGSEALRRSDGCRRPRGGAPADREGDREVAERVDFLKTKPRKADFAERAPAEIVARERERLVEQEAVHAKLVASLAGSMTPGGSALGVVVRLRHSRFDPVCRLRARRARRRRSHGRGRRSAAAGRGRRGEPGARPPGRACCLDHRAAAPAAGAPVHLVAHDAVAAAEALRRVTHVGRAAQVAERRPRVGRKIAGILLESRMAGIPAPGGSAHAGSAIVTIIGVVMNLGQLGVPVDLADARRRSRSRRDGRPAAKPCSTPSRGVRRLAGHGSRAKALARSREGWRRLSDTLGRRVTIDGRHRYRDDLDVDGALLIDVGGSVKRVVPAP